MVVIKQARRTEGGTVWPHPRSQTLGISQVQKDANGKSNNLIAVVTCSRVCSIQYLGDSHKDTLCLWRPPCTQALFWEVEDALHVLSGHSKWLSSFKSKLSTLSTKTNHNIALNRLRNSNRELVIRIQR